MLVAQPVAAAYDSTAEVLIPYLTRTLVYAAVPITVLVEVFLFSVVELRGRRPETGRRTPDLDRRVPATEGWLAQTPGTHPAWASPVASVTTTYRATTPTDVRVASDTGSVFPG